MLLGSSSVGKESACTAGDLGGVPDREDPLEEEMATHSSILAWKNPMDRRTWQAIVHGIARVRYDLVTKLQNH